MKKLFLILLIIPLCWIGNYYYFQQHQLEDAIFLKHYYEIPYHEDWQGVYFDIYYVENRVESNPVSYFSLDGRRLIYQVEPELRNSYLQYQYFNLNRALVNVTIEDITHVLEDDNHGIIEELIVGYKDGSSQIVDIGEIHLIHADDMEGRSNLLSFRSSQSSDHEGYIDFHEIREITFTEIEISFEEYLMKDIHIEVDNSGNMIDELPLLIRRGQRIAYSFQDIPDQDLYFHLYQANVKLKYETLDGKEGHISIRYDESERVYFSESEIRQLVKDRRSIQ